MYDKGIQGKPAKEVLENKGRRMESTVLKIILISHRCRQLKKHRKSKNKALVPLNFLVFFYIDSSLITAVAVNEQVCVSCFTGYTAVQIDLLASGP